MNTVIFSSYEDCDDCYNYSAIFISGDEYVDAGHFEIWTHTFFDESRLSDVEKFDFFEKLFDKKVDRLVILKNARCIDMLLKANVENLALKEKVK